MHVLRQDAQAAAAGEGRGESGPVTEFMFALMIGIVAPEPSFAARSTSKRLVTPDRLGTRKTSE